VAVENFFLHSWTGRDKTETNAAVAGAQCLPIATLFREKEKENTVLLALKEACLNL